MLAVKHGHGSTICLDFDDEGAGALDHGCVVALFVVVLCDVVAGVAGAYYDGAFVLTVGREDACEFGGVDEGSFEVCEAWEVSGE